MAAMKAIITEIVLALTQHEVLSDAFLGALKVIVGIPSAILAVYGLMKLIEKRRKRYSTTKELSRPNTQNDLTEWIRLYARLIQPRLEVVLNGLKKEGDGALLLKVSEAKDLVSELSELLDDDDLRFQVLNQIYDEPKMTFLPDLEEFYKKEKRPHIKKRLEKTIARVKRSGR